MDVSVSVTGDVETGLLSFARDVRAARAAALSLHYACAFARVEETLAPFDPASFQLALPDVRLEGADVISLALGPDV